MAHIYRDYDPKAPTDPRPGLVHTYIDAEPGCDDPAEQVAVVTSWHATPGEALKAWQFARQQGWIADRAYPARWGSLWYVVACRIANPSDARRYPLSRPN